MTPQLQQALKLLQMPSLELQQILKQEMVMNPVLEEVEEVEESLQSEEENTAEEKIEKEREKEEEKEKKDENDTEESETSDDRTEIDWDEYFHSPQDYSYYRRGEQENSDEHYERVPSTAVCLSEHLLSQLRIETDDPGLLDAGEFLIGSLDERGFLGIALDDVAAAVGVSLEKVEEALALLQTFDPSGVGARNLRETLLLQLKQGDLENTRAWQIVNDHFEDLVQNRYMDLARKLKTTPREIQAAAMVIGKMNPRPGILFSHDDPRYISPDLVVDRVDDQFIVCLNDQNVPRLRVSKAYEGILADKNGSSSETRNYIRNKLTAANQLINTIERRRRTMVKVMNSIVENQREFFESGIRHLKPLTLQQVAEQIGMHESTVSRVTSGKYVQTPRGVFELKFFFSSSIRSDTGEDVSAKRVKDRVKELIAGEEKKKPLSDQRIVDILKREGFLIARRTIAKYREQMGILSARYRKGF